MTIGFSRSHNTPVRTLYAIERWLISLRLFSAQDREHWSSKLWAYKCYRLGLLSIRRWKLGWIVHIFRKKTNNNTKNDTNWTSQWNIRRRIPAPKWRNIIEALEKVVSDNGIIWTNLIWLNYTPQWNIRRRNLAPKWRNLIKPLEKVVSDNGIIWTNRVWILFDLTVHRNGT